MGASAANLSAMSAYCAEVAVALTILHLMSTKVASVELMDVGSAAFAAARKAVHAPLAAAS
jgi:hypothetical protein